MNELSIALGKSRETKVWKNTKITWEGLVKRLANTDRTHESYKEYCAMPKERQSVIKDHGGFVGGYLKEGKRSPGTVAFRQLLTLDLDLPTFNFWDDYTMCYGAAAVIHSTHKHGLKTPRYRLVIPLNRTVNKIEYEAIARRLAGTLDINLFDPTTFQPERLMYWPTTSRDGEFFFEEQEGDWLDADKMLSTYINFEDISEWPMLETEKDFLKLGGKLAGVPTEKPGLIGAFCRAYTIQDAIETFLPDIYEPTTVENRYTYTGGSGASGAIVYDNGNFLYSHHGTDPVHNRLVNAYDLVRIHLFGAEDQGEKELAKQKSNRLMADMAAKDSNVAKEAGLADIAGDFEVWEDTDWLGDLTKDKYGKTEPTIPNFKTIIENDPELTGRFYYDLFYNKEVARRPLPWDKGVKGITEFTDADDANLRDYLEKKYKIYHATKSSDAVNIIFRKNGFHPIRDYIDKLKWDGKSRIDRILIDCLNAEDTTFNRLATRKTLVAAVARVYNPGCKFDYVLTLSGPEGIGKSTIFDKLAGKWFSDTFVGVEGNRAFEQLQGVWILEMGELSGIKKAEVDAVKAFVSKKVDSWREAYGHRKSDKPRQLIFVATTNDFYFLKSQNGDRRFWPVYVSGYGLVNIEDLEVDQIWAEAKELYDTGEKLYFDADIEEQANDVQKQHTETDDRAGMVQEYLNLLLPEDWKTRSIADRRNFIHSHDITQGEGTKPRFAVCVAEIWTELFKGDPIQMGSHNTKYVHQIMNNSPGWEKAKSNLTFPLYGKQRAYVRIKTDVTHVDKRAVKRKEV